MSTTTSRKKKLLKTVTVSLGCSCRRPKLSSIFSPKPKPKYHQTQYFNHHYYHPPSSSSTTTTNFSDADYYYNTTNATTTTTNTSSSSPFMAADEFGRAVVGGGWTEAIEKDSSDPYLDFRASMLQMIVENEMYTKDDLRHLLTCFLQLNSPCLHGVIIKAFTEIWNTFLFSDARATTSTSHISAQVHEKSYNGRRGGGRKDGYGSRPPKAYDRAKSYEI